MSLVLLLACVPQTLLQSVEVSGTIDGGSDGVLYGEVHHARSGEGNLSYPGGLIEDFPVDDDGTFWLEVMVPIEEGAGLAVYAWEDVDGDGALCGLEQSDEFAGADVSETLSDELVFAVTLTEACAGPEVLIAEAD